MPRATTLHVLGSTLVVTLALISACGKGSAPPPAPPLDPAHVRMLGGATDLPLLLEHAERGQAAMLAGLTAKFPDLPKQVAEAKAKPGGDLGSNAGWEAAGLDPSGGLGVLVDDRMGGDGDEGGGWNPILLVKVADRAKLFASFHLTSDAPAAAAAPPGVEVVRVSGEPRALMAAHGALTAFTLVRDRDPAALDALRARFQSVLAGGGALGDDPTYRAALRGRAGPGVHVFIGARGLDALGDLPFASRRERRELRDVLGKQAAAIGVRVDPEGVVVRVVPQPGVREAVEAGYRGTDDPPDLGQFVPAKGWVAGRLSIDLAHGLPQLMGLMAVGDNMLQSLLSRDGLSFGELTEALSGDVGVAVDLESILRRFDGYAGDAGPSYVGMIGVRDESSADALVAKLGALMLDRARGARRVMTTIADLPAVVFQLGDTSIVVVRRGKVILVAPSEMAAQQALTRDPSLAGTDAGKVLRKRNAIAIAAELSPLTAFVDRLMRRDADEDRFALLSAFMSFTYLPAWKAFRDEPVVTLEVGWDDDAAVFDLRGGGLVYGYLATAIGGASQWVGILTSAAAHRREVPVAASGDLVGAPSCARYLAGLRACMAAISEDKRSALAGGLAQTEEAWKSITDKSVLDAGCKSALDAAKDGMAKICPAVTWD